MPPMLRPSFGSPITCYERDTHTFVQTRNESMEAFLNLPQSEGVDSFMNMAEPKFSESLMSSMNASILSTSAARSPSKDDSGSFLCMADSQILTNSMMQTSMFDETKDINSFLAPFANEDNNVTVKSNVPGDATLTEELSFHQDVVTDPLKDQEEDQEEDPVEDLNVTFTSGSKSAELAENLLNATYSALDVDEDRDAGVDATREAPQLELREELLMGAKTLDSTFDVNFQKENVADMNLTYEKSVSEDNKFQTFSMKTYKAWKKDMDDAGDEADKLNLTFQKPSPPKAAQRKLPIPRQNLSRLPQILQKSNPNLVTGSLSLGKASLRNPGGSHPNIAASNEKQIGSKLSLGRFKGGSEQRLQQVARHVSDLQICAASGGGSTESIESTQSAHSAPDFDDRVSICSDSSRGSYTICKVGNEQFRKIGFRDSEFWDFSYCCKISTKLNSDEY